MLQHKPSTQQPPPLAPTRVTPEELAQAITAIEARHPLDNQGEVGPQALADVIQQLNISASPEEIIEEVQRQRESRRHRRMLRRSIMAASAVLITSLGGLLTHDLTAAQEPEPVTFLPLSHVERELVVQDNSGKTPMLRTLAEVPDGRTVLCNADALVLIEQAGRTEDGSWVSERAQTFNAELKPWPIVKYGSSLYLRGWTTARLTTDAARHGVITLTPGARNAADGSHTVPITLRLTEPIEPPVIGWHIRQSGEELIVSHLTLDHHAWEKW